MEMYNEWNRWYTIKVILADGTTAMIHSSYLAEMQSPSFVADMAALEK